MQAKAEPHNDGITHINVYSQGRTELGRLLSNFAFSPFHRPKHGNFVSVEGFWYWLKTGRSHDHLRTLHGSTAKREGVRLTVVPYPDFEKDVSAAIAAKIRQTPRIQELLVESSLPFLHYYVYGNRTYDLTKRYHWQLDVITDLRDELQLDRIASG